MNENVLLSFGPILNEPWAIDARRCCCVLPPVIVDSKPRFAKDWLDMAPSGDDLDVDFFLVDGKLEDVLWMDKYIDYEKD